MKKNSRFQTGFSLTELLVVIVIIIILAGFTIGALPGIQVRINRAKVEAFLEEIQAGLSRYQVEYGNYPLNPETGVTSDDPSTRDSEGIEGAAVLYKHLSGDFDLDGEVDDNEVVYVQRLGGKANETSKDRRVIGDPGGGGGYIIVDGFNSPIRYLAEKPNKKDKMTINPDFDLWSIVDTDPDKADDETVRAKYITNWTRN
jgi:prepilin-type N-terminal cleavage/methylation domain-containing protein